jgi:GH25 family lysozyme M1 (1,4-beta-N-acetylmuramidase)
MLGAYFFSTAVSEEEAIEEANWAADLIDQYSITYPVAYDCEGYNEPESRQYGLSKKNRTDIALAFLKQIEKRGYEGMFYSSKNELEDDQGWLTSKIEKDYKIWVAQYPAVAYPATEKTTYSGKHHMWQYTTNGVVPGVSQNVDMNVAYFGYKEINDPISDIPPEEAEPDVEAMLNFQEVNETVTAKESTNLRSIPSQGEDSIVLYTLQNGEEATRIAVSDSGWSKVEFNGNIYYAVSSYLTTDMNYNAVPEFEEESEDDGVETRFVAVNEKVTAKIEVNLRTLPSVEHPDCKVVTLLKNGTVVTRTGVNDEVGWSRLEYNGQTVYCVSSMLKVVN